MANQRNLEWALPEGALTYKAAQLAVLMDIRSELRTLNAVFRCVNFTNLTTIVGRIETNTRPKRTRRSPRRSKG